MIICKNGTWWLQSMKTSQFHIFSNEVKIIVLGPELTKLSISFIELILPKLTKLWHYYCSVS